jgi:hypothetical protein
MPQHPRYSNSPEKNYENLSNLLWELEKFAFIHAEIDQPINELMSKLYPEITNRYILRNNDLPLDANIADYDEEELDTYLPSVYEIWEQIHDDQKEQFVQDYQNVIGACVFGNGYRLSYDKEFIDELIKLRDLDYYRMNILVDCDPQTQNLFKNDERTIWFPQDIFPLRVGIYEISKVSYDEPYRVSGYAHWDGKKWHDSSVLLADCINQKRSKQTSRDYGYMWRGFTASITPKERLEREQK